MNKNITILFFVLFVVSSIFSQNIPQAFNWQGIIKDNTNSPIVNASIGIQFVLHQDTANGIVVYTETHTTTTTNVGLVTLIVGSGTTSDDFSTINWSIGNYFLEIGVDLSGGTTYTTIGTNQLLSVPFSLLSSQALETIALKDNDGDTSVEVEKNTNENVIRLNAGGREIIQINDEGHVGINTTPTSYLEVKTNDGVTTFIDQQQTEWNNSSALSNIWQSFTAETTSNIRQIDLVFYFAGVNTTLSIYEGEGNTGTLLHSQAITTYNIDDWSSYYLDTAVPIIAGNKYSIEISTPANWRFSNLNPYDGGTSSFAARDFTFKIYVDSPGWKFKINDDGLQINNYKLPFENGTQNQVLTSNSDGVSFWKEDLDNQNLELTNNVLFLTNDTTPVDLSLYLDNTDNQDLSLTGTILSLSNDVTPVDLSNLLDENYNQDLSLNNNTLTLTGDATTVDLSNFLDNTDNQDLSLTGTILSLSNDVTPVDLSNLLDENYNQDLSLNNNILSLTGDATTVDLSTYLDNTDNQSLSLSGTSLSIINGGTVDLSSINTDTQDLSFTGTDLSLTNGGSVDLSTLKDNLGNHTATQNINLNNKYLSPDGSNNGLKITTDGINVTNFIIGKLTFLDSDVSILGALQTNGNYISNGSTGQGILIGDNEYVGINTSNYTTLTAPSKELEIVGDGATTVKISGNYDNSTGVNGAQIVLESNNSQRAQGTYHINRSDSHVWYSGTTYNAGGDEFQVGYVSTGGSTTYSDAGRPAASKFKIYATGNATLAGTLTENSDKRLKQNFIPLTNAIDKVNQIQAYYYEWKDAQTRGNQREMGVIAQEVQKVAPELVTEDDQGILSVSYSKMSALLLAAIKEQQSEMIQLKEENKVLKEQIQSNNNDIETIKLKLGID